MNEDWHRKNPMPSNACEEWRVSWHSEHETRCGCRPVPADLREKVDHWRREHPMSNPSAKDRM